MRDWERDDKRRETKKMKNRKRSGEGAFSSWDSRKLLKLEGGEMSWNAIADKLWSETVG